MSSACSIARASYSSFCQYTGEPLTFFRNLYTCSFLTSCWITKGLHSTPAVIFSPSNVLPQESVIARFASPSICFISVMYFAQKMYSMFLAKCVSTFSNLCWKFLWMGKFAVLSSVWYAPQPCGKDHERPELQNCHPARYNDEHCLHQGTLIYMIFQTFKLHHTWKCITSLFRKFLHCMHIYSSVHCTSQVIYSADTKGHLLAWFSVLFPISCCLECLIIKWWDKHFSTTSLQTL